MNRLKQLKTYPFGFFLCLEWILLGAAVFGELSIVFLDGQLDREPILTSIFSLFCLIGLGLTGLRLPQNNTLYKWLYTLWQLGLLCLLISVGYRLFFIPHLIIVTRSCLIFERKESLLATILVVVVYVTLETSQFPSFYEFRQHDRVTLEQFAAIRNIEIASNLFLSIFCSAVVFMMVNALLKEYKSRQKLREYAMLAEDRATLAERNRIAREIHDSVGHTLTAQNIQLDSAIAFWQLQPDEAYSFLLEAKDLATLTLEEIRSSVATLRDDPIKEKSLKTAIDVLVKEFSQRTNIYPQCDISLTYLPTEEIKITLYRILQEALTNIAKHSEAKTVRINLKSYFQHLHLLIEDNGNGFDPQQNTTGFGLQGMRERVAALEGKLQISSSFNRGCSISINIPRQSFKL